MTTVTTLTTKLDASLEQLEVTQKELAGERRNFFFLNRKLEEVAEQVQRREKARWRRVLFLLLTVVLGAATGAAAFGVFLWLYNRGIITFG